MYIIYMDFSWCSILILEVYPKSLLMDGPLFYFEWEHGKRVGEIRDNLYIIKQINLVIFTNLN